MKQHAVLGMLGRRCLCMGLIQHLLSQHHLCDVGCRLCAGFKMEQDSGRFKATFEFQAPCLLK
jgi:hypothetical protein